MDDLSFPDNPNTIITLLALELDPQLKLFPFLGIKKVHKNLGTVALHIQKNLFKDQIRAVEHYKRFDSDFVVEVLMLWLFVLVEL